MRLNAFAPQHWFVLVLLPVIIALFWPTISVLAGRWVEWDKGLSHGLLVAAVFVWLLWQSPVAAGTQHWLALRLACVAVASLLWFVLQSVQINVLAEVALLLVIIAAYLASFGFKPTWRYKAVLLLPLFATSVWGELNDAALLLSSVVVGYWVELAGITAHLEGFTISLPYGQIIIADGCSGLRYLVIALALGHMLACLNHYPARGYWLTIAVALALGLFTNWVRIFVLVLVGYYSQMKSGLVADHETFGWLLFAGVVLPPLYFAPLRKRQTLIAPKVAPNLPRLLLIAGLVSLGPALLVFGQRAPAPSAWPAPLPTAALPPPSWAIQTPMPQAGRVEQGWLDGVWVQRWQYQRRDSQDKLVPFIDGKWYADSQCKRVPSGLAGAWFECTHKEHSLLVVRRFEVGRFTTTDYRRAKLLQLPAQWLGDNRFSLSQWQQRCDVNGCKQASIQISALLNRPTQ